MKATYTNNEELKGFGFEVLTDNEMMEVRGGGTDTQPTTRDRDIYRRRNKLIHFSFLKKIKKT